MAKSLVIGDRRVEKAVEEEEEEDIAAGESENWTLIKIAAATKTSSEKWHYKRRKTLSWVKMRVYLFYLVKQTS